MSNWLYTAETGLSDGTDVTPANSGIGTAGFAFDLVSKVGTGTVKYSTANPLRGALSLEFKAPVTNDVGRVEISTLFSSSNIVLDIAFRTPTFSSVGCRVIELLASGVSALRINITTTGNIEAYNAANSIIWTSTSTVNVDTTGWRIGIRCAPGASTSTGRLELSYYSTQSATSATESMTTITTGNFGVNPLTQLRVGKITSAPTWTALYADDIQIDDTRVTLFDSPPADDTVSAGDDQINVEPWTMVTLTATSSSGSVTWSHISGPNPVLSGSGLSRTFIAPSAFVTQTSVFRAANGTATDDVSVTYLPATDGIVVSINPVVVQPIRITRKV